MSVPRPRHWQRWFLTIVVFVTAVLVTAVVVARKRFNGPPLANDIASMLNQKMRGRIEIGSIEWPTDAFKKAATGGWVSVTVRDVKIWDDCAQNRKPGDSAAPNPAAPLPCGKDDKPTAGREPRKLVLATSLITAQIDIHALMFGNHDFVLRQVTVVGGQVLLEQTAEPYPLYPYDKTVMSLLTAFYPRERPVFRAGIYADKPPPIFDLRDIHLSGVDVYGHFGMLKDGGFATTLQVRGVSLNVEAASNAGFLYMDGRDPLSSKFYVSAPMTSKGATLRMIDLGKPAQFAIGVDPKTRYQAYKIEFVDLTVNRLAQLPESWSDDNYVASTLYVDLIAHTKQGAEISVRGRLADYFDRPFGGAWDLKVEGQNLGPTLHDEINEKIGGASVSATLMLSGPFIAPPKMDWSIAGLEATIPIGQGEPGQPPPAPLALALDTLKGSVDLVNDEGHIEETHAFVKDSVPPGELTLSAKFGLDPYALSNVNIDIVKPIDVARFMPPALVKSLGHYVSGRFSGMGDTGDTFKINEIDFYLGQSRTDRSIHIHDGSLTTVGGLAEASVRNRRIDANATHGILDGFMCTGIYAGRLTVRANDPNEGMAPTRCLVDGTKPPVPLPMSANLVMRNLNSTDLGTWLRRFGKPPMVAGIRDGNIVVTGTLPNPTVRVSGELLGVATVGNMKVRGTFKDGTFDLDDLVSTNFGGTLSGKGRVLLKNGAFVEKLTFHGRQLDASMIPGMNKTLVGKIDTLDASVHGKLAGKNDPLDYLDLLSAHMTSSQMTVAGEALTNIEVCVNPGATVKAAQVCVRPSADAKTDCIAANGRGQSCALAHAERVLGGTVEADITTQRAPGTRNRNPQTTFEADVTLGALPIETLRALGPNPTLGGLLSSSFRINGTVDKPVANGFIALERAWLLDQFLGDIALRASPGVLLDGSPALVLSGSAQDGQLALTAHVGTKAPYFVEARIDARRLEIDGFVDVAKRFGLNDPLRGWVSGSLSLRAAIVNSPEQPPPEAWLELSELELVAERRDPRGRVLPLSISARSGATITGKNRPAVSIHATPTSLEFACRDGVTVTPCGATILTPAGAIELGGKADANGIAFVGTGKLDLALLQALLGGYVDSIAGTAELDASIGGTLTVPTYSAQVRLDDVRVRPLGQDTVVRIPSGLIKLNKQSLGFTDVRVKVDDPYLEEASELVIKGGLKLDDSLQPISWAVIIEGQIAGKLLMALVPKSISQASGVATIDDSILLTGQGALPQIEATITFNDKHPLAIIPRGVPREIAMAGGGLTISSKTSAGGNRSYSITLDDVASNIDGEGRLRNIRGEVDIADGGIAGADITAVAQSLPFRVPGSLDLSLSSDNLRALKSSAKDPWQFEGNIAVVNGTYLRDIQLNEFLKPTAPPQGANKPIWETYPDLGNASLDLRVSVRRFSVANNIADIDMDGELDLTGSPRDPRLSGQIKVSRGQFRMQGTRVKFTNTKGSVDFAPNRRFPQYTPTMNITSLADFRDQQGQDHLITLELGGTLSEPLWDLRTSTGYNKAQTVALLVTGRTPDQLRRSLGDQSIGVDPLRVDTSTNAGQGLGDQVVKDLVGDWVSSLFRSPLEKIFALDVLKIELNFNSIGIKGEKKLLENLRAIVDAEQTFRGNTLNTRIEFRTPTGFTLQGAYLNKDYNDPAERDIQEYEAKLVYRFYIP